MYSLYMQKFILSELKKICQNFNKNLFRETIFLYKGLRIHICIMIVVRQREISPHFHARKYLSAI